VTALIWVSLEGCDHNPLLWIILEQCNLVQDTHLDTFVKLLYQCMSLISLRVKCLEGAKEIGVDFLESLFDLRVEHLRLDEGGVSGKIVCLVHERINIQSYLELSSDTFTELEYRNCMLFKSRILDLDINI